MVHRRGTGCNLLWIAYLYFGIRPTRKRNDTLTKTHVINLVIVNNTADALTYADDYFQTGRLADNNAWPTTIKAGTTATAQCYESDFSPVGCSGWVKYSFDGYMYPVFFAFSNPSAGQNGIDLGSDTAVWDAMTSHYEYPVSRPLELDTETFLDCGRREHVRRLEHGDVLVAADP